VGKFVIEKLSFGEAGILMTLSDRLATALGSVSRVTELVFNLSGAILGHIYSPL
jgi:hypothetical protein